MPTGLVSPGTKVREVDLTQGRIDSVTTTTGAIVAPFARGPVEEPTLIDSEQKLIDIFGKPSENDNQYEYWLSASNYLTYGGILQVVRVDDGNLNNANVGIAATSVTLSIKNYDDYQSNYTTAGTWYWAAKDPGSWANGIKVCVVDSLADQIISGVNTANANIVVGAAITQANTTVVAGVGTTSVLTGFLKGIVTEIGESNVSVKVVSQVSSGNTETAVTYSENGAYAFTVNTLNIGSTVFPAVNFLITTISNTVAIGSTIIFVTSTSGVSVGSSISVVGPGTMTTRPVVSVGATFVQIGAASTVGSVLGIGTAVTFSSIGVGSQFSATSVTDWYNEQSLNLVNSNLFWKEVADKPKTSNFARTRSSKNDEFHVVVVDDTGTISGTPGTILEKFVGLSKAKDATSSTSGPIYYKDFIADNSAYIYAGDSELGNPTGFSSGITTITTAAGQAGLNAQGVTFHASGAQTFALTGGNNYVANDSADPRFETTLGDLIAGYDLFSNKREYPINFLIQGPGFGTKEQTQAKANKLIQIAELRKDCIACISPQRSAVLVDPGAGGSSPSPIANTSTQTTNVISFFDALSSSSYAVFDSGYKYQYDRFSNKFRYIPLNADIAGCMARTGITDFTWFSPAGIRRGVINNAVKLAYNPSQTERDLLYPRRINPVIFTPGSGIILFGDKTGLAVGSAFDRINVRRLFITIEDSIERASRASLFEFNDALTRTNFVNIVEPFLRDVKAKRGIQDFIVICDETNNTPAVIDANEFIADIYVKPARSINFIGLTFVATRTGVSFEEVIGRV